MIPKRTNGTILEDYGLLNICNNCSFILLDTSAATDNNCSLFNQETRIKMRKYNIKYNPPIEKRIEYNSMISLLMTSYPLYVTEMVLEEIYNYRKFQRGGLLKSIDQLIRAIEVGIGKKAEPRLISLKSTDEYYYYLENTFFKKLAEQNCLSETDIDLLAQFFAALHHIDGKCALVTNDRGILDTYKAFGHRLIEGDHVLYSCLFRNKYSPTFHEK